MKGLGSCSAFYLKFLKFGLVRSFLSRYTGQPAISQSIPDCLQIYFSLFRSSCEAFFTSVAENIAEMTAILIVPVEII